MYIHDILTMAEEEEVRKLNIPNAIIHWSGPYTFTEVIKKSGGGLYVTVSKKGAPLYVGQTGSYISRFKSRAHVLRIASCNQNHRGVYIGKIVMPKWGFFNKKLRLDLESVLIRSYLNRSRPIALINKSSIRKFMVGPKSALITNKGTIPPKMKMRISVKGNTHFELNSLDDFQEEYENVFKEFDGIDDFELFKHENTEIKRRKKPRRPRGLKRKKTSSRSKPLLFRPRSRWRNRSPRRRLNIFRRRRRLTQPSMPCSNSPVGTEYVRWVQSSLNQILGLRLRINGIMSLATREALRDYQQREGLQVDGIAGPETERSLIEARTG